MKRNYFFIIVLIAIGCLFLIFYSLWREIQAPLTKPLINEPPKSPYKTFISGVGIVEASSGNILISTPVSRLVDSVLVKEGEKVKKGDKLLCLESKDLQANLNLQEIAYEKAKAEYQKLQEFPRAEDVNAAFAQLQRSQIELDQAQYQHEMVLRLPDPRAISEEEKQRRAFNFQQAKANWEQNKADYEKIEKGTWKPDLEIAYHAVQEALARIQQVKTEIERTCILSPIDGTVLQVNIHPGEFALESYQVPLMILGNIDELYLRVSINQLDIPYFNPEAPAEAFLQDNKHASIPLTFIRNEPYLTSKKYLSNGILERMDTKVFEIIYQIKQQKDIKLFVGEIMDVFIETMRPQHEAAEKNTMQPNVKPADEERGE